MGLIELKSREDIAGLVKGDVIETSQEGRLVMIMSNQNNVLEFAYRSEKGTIFKTRIKYNWLGDFSDISINQGKLANWYGSEAAEASELEEYNSLLIKEGL